MSNTGRSVAYNGAFGFLLGYGTRLGFDNYNRNKMLEKYQATGQVPKKKSLGLALVLASVFGSFGLFYISPRTALPIALIELALFPLMVFSIVVRPIALFIAFVATMSYNSMIPQFVRKNTRYHYDRHKRREWE